MRTWIDGPRTGSDRLLRLKSSTETQFKEEKFPDIFLSINIEVIFFYIKKCPTKTVI